MDAVTKPKRSAVYRNLVHSEIPKFQDFCLNSGFDFIFPIEREGLSLLLPAIKRNTQDPEIIPTSSLERFNKTELESKLKDKSILIEDASTFSGKTMTALSKWFERNHPSATVSLASMMIFKGSTTDIKLSNEQPLLFGENEYDWAREGLLDYFHENVFSYHSDPPVWSFSQTSGDVRSLFAAIKKLGHLTVLPSFSGDSKWIRCAVDGVHISVKNWLPLPMYSDTLVKIRLFVNKESNELRIVPLFFPVVPKTTSVELTDALIASRTRFPKEFNDVVDFSSGITSTPEVMFRWMTTVGSMLLLKVFLVEMARLKIHLKPLEPFMLSPIPNLRNYSCSSEVLKSIENVVIRYSNQILNNDLTDVVFDEFSFRHYQFKNEWYQRKPKNDLRFFAPEKYLGILLGSAIDDRVVSEKNGLLTWDMLDRPNISFDNLARLGGSLNMLGLSRGTDILVDEAFLNPTMVVDASINTRRGYYVGGESKRNVLHILGASQKLLTLT